MNTQTLLALISALVPVGEQIASIFIHNPNSQHKFGLIVGTADALEPVVAGVASTLSTSASNATVNTAAAATPAATPAAAASVEPVIPAGVPSGH